MRVSQQVFTPRGRAFNDYCRPTHETAYKNRVKKSVRTYLERVPDVWHSTLLDHSRQFSGL